MMKKITTNKAPAAIGPYSQALVHGGIVYTSGQIPLCPDTGEMVGVNVKQQCEQVIRNLAAVLEKAGASLESVLKTTCFIADMADFADFNEVYARYFTGKPARSCVAVKQLPKGALVEIECVAVVADGC